VGESEAKHIDVVHGYTEAFARILRMRGFSAWGAPKCFLPLLYSRGSARGS
jgi:hypothetical protein